jgi:hypothetical protein
MMTNLWPELPLKKWIDTYTTLHMWTQIIGKIRLILSPFINHWWNTTFYVTPRGLTTSSIPYNDQYFQIDFDFIVHRMIIETTDSSTKTIALRARSVADFFKETMSALSSLGISVTIWTTPVEVQDRTPFEKNYKHSSYDPEYAQRFWRILVQASRIFTIFRSRFTGKASPVHFFWGAFDLAATRFSGRTAPIHPGVPNCGRFVMIDAYSHELSSCGFWPGGGPVDEPAFYAYAYPEPKGFKNYRIQPPGAFYQQEMGEFILPYDLVRKAKSPDDLLLSFLQSTYEAAAINAKWDRLALERQ